MKKILLALCLVLPLMTACQKKEVQEAKKSKIEVEEASKVVESKKNDKISKENKEATKEETTSIDKNKEQSEAQKKEEAEKKPEDQEKTEDLTAESKTESVAQNNTNSAPLTTTSYIDRIQDELQTRLSGTSGTWSVSIVNLQSGEAIDYQNTQMKAASLIKLFVAGAFLENLEEKGLSVNGSQDGYLSNMLSNSDNESTNVLIREMGNGNFESGLNVVNTWIQNYGFGSTRIERALGDISNPNKENYTSAYDVSRFLSMVYYDSFSQSGVGSYIQEKLINQSRRVKIPQGITGVTIANKTGELPLAEHDGAIIYGDQPFVLVIMSQNLSGNGVGISKIQELASVIYENMINQ